MGAWHLSRMAPFDLESTGPNPEDAQIVQAYAGFVGGGLAPVDLCDMVVDPGVPVPAESTEIHGLTTEYVREHGTPAATAIDIITATVASALADGIPIVGHNIRYDLTVLDRECRRHGLPTLADRTPVAPVLDTQILSKRVDQFRRRVSEEQGAQALKTCCQAFNVPWNDEEAHGARYDALASARVAFRIGQIAAMPMRERPRRQGREIVRFNDVAVSIERLHQLQVQWAREQDAGLKAYFLREGAAVPDGTAAAEFYRRAESCTGHWPVYPHDTGQQQALIGGGA